MLRSCLFIVALLIAFLLGWWSWEETSQTFDPFREYVLKQAARQIADAIPPPLFPQLLYIIPLDGDQNNQVTQTLVQELDNSGKFRCLPPDKTKQQKKPDYRKEALQELGKKLRVELIGYGKIVRFSKTSQRSELIIRLSLYSPQQQKYLVKEQNFTGTLEKGWTLAYYRAWIASQPVWARVLLWLVAVTLLPFVFLPRVSQVLAQESNQGNFWLLVGFSGISFVLACALSGFSLAHYHGLLLFLALVASVVISYVLLSWLEYIRK